MTRLYITRHPQCELNRLGKYQGVLDSPFTPLGEAQLQALTARLKPEGIMQVVADGSIGRLQKAASAISRDFGIPFIPDPNFAEANYGAWEGLTKQQCAERDPELWARFAADEINSDFSFPNGDNIGDIERRLSAGFERLALPEKALIVGSNMSGRLLIRLLTGQEPPRRLQQCSLTILESNGSGWHVVLLADESHLPAKE